MHRGGSGLTSGLGGGEWSTSRPRRSDNPWIESLVGPRAGLNIWRKENFLVAAGFRIPDHAARSLVSIPVVLSQFHWLFWLHKMWGISWLVDPQVFKGNSAPKSWSSGYLVVLLVVVVVFICLIETLLKYFRIVCIVNVEFVTFRIPSLHCEWLWTELHCHYAVDPNFSLTVCLVLVASPLGSQKWTGHVRARCKVFSVSSNDGNNRKSQCVYCWAQGCPVEQQTALTIPLCPDCWRKSSKNFDQNTYFRRAPWWHPQ